MPAVAVTLHHTTWASLSAAESRFCSDELLKASHPMLKNRLQCSRMKYAYRNLGPKLSTVARHDIHNQ